MISPTIPNFFSEVPQFWIFKNSPTVICVLHRPCYKSPANIDMFRGKNKIWMYFHFSGGFINTEISYYCGCWGCGCSEAAAVVAAATLAVAEAVVVVAAAVQAAAAAATVVHAAVAVVAAVAAHEKAAVVVVDAALDLGCLAPASEVKGGHILQFWKGHGLPILKWYGMSSWVLGGPS
jgi:hypothetical protein